MSARQMWLVAHRWIGLTIGLVFVLLGLTGSVLVFDHAIDEWINPEVLLTNGSGSGKPIQEIISAAETARQSQALSVSTPRVENGNWTVWFMLGELPEVKFVSVHVDPHTAEVKGERVWGDYLMTWIYRLHFQLVAGRIGGILVGVIGVIMLLSVVSGIVLWWPLFRKSWTAAFALRRGSRFNFDLHKTTGIFSAGLLLVIAFTGVYMEFPDLFRAVIGRIGEESPTPENLTSENSNGRRPITADEALALARPLYPQAKFDHLHPPEDEWGTFEVAFRQDGEVQQSYGRTQVFLDQYSGEVVAIHSPEKFTAADHFYAWQFPLHNGEAFGLVGRWIVFVIGLVPTVLYVTGLLLWVRRGRARRRETVETNRLETVATPA